MQWARKLMRPAPTFRPTVDEFADFAAYVSTIAESAAKYGIAKVVPPDGWAGPPKQLPSGTFKLEGAIVQIPSGRSGLYTVLNVQRGRTSFERFEREAKAYAIRERVSADATLDDLEDKFWSEIVGARPPTYGADLDGSRFPADVASWNLNTLPDLLRQGPSAIPLRMSGINTPMLYFGTFRSTSVLHVKDMDLLSEQPTLTLTPTFTPTQVRSACRGYGPLLDQLHARGRAQAVVRRALVERNDGRAARGAVLS